MPAPATPTFANTAGSTGRVIWTALGPDFDGLGWPRIHNARYVYNLFGGQANGYISDYAGGEAVSGWTLTNMTVTGATGEQTLTATAAGGSISADQGEFHTYSRNAAWTPVWYSFIVDVTNTTGIIRLTSAWTTPVAAGNTVDIDCADLTGKIGIAVRLPVAVATANPVAKITLSLLTNGDSVVCHVAQMERCREAAPSEPVYSPDLAPLTNFFLPFEDPSFDPAYAGAIFGATYFRYRAFNWLNGNTVTTPGVGGIVTYAKGPMITQPMAFGPRNSALTDRIGNRFLPDAATKTGCTGARVANVGGPPGFASIYRLTSTTTTAPRLVTNAAALTAGHSHLFQAVVRYVDNPMIRFSVFNIGSTNFRQTFNIRDLTVGLTTNSTADGGFSDPQVVSLKYGDGTDSGLVLVSVVWTTYTGQTDFTCTPGIILASDNGVDESPPIGRQLDVLVWGFGVRPWPNSAQQTKYPTRGSETFYLIPGTTTNGTAAAATWAYTGIPASNALTVHYLDGRVDQDGVLDWTGGMSSTPDSVIKYVVRSDDGLEDWIIDFSKTAGVPVWCPPPAPVDDAAETASETPVNIQVMANDADTYTVAAVTQGSNGTVVLETDGTVTYTPAAGFAGVDTFTYDAANECGSTVTATVTVTVTASGGRLPARKGARRVYEFSEPDLEPEQKGGKRPSKKKRASAERRPIHEEVELPESPHVPEPAPRRADDGAVMAKLSASLDALRALADNLTEQARVQAEALLKEARRRKALLLLLLR
jgi:hypothetical protein